MTDQEKKDLAEAGRMLLYVSTLLDGLRFAGTDQNPDGIRDTLYSYAAKVDRIAKCHS